MLQRLVHFSLKFRGVVVVLACVLLGYGIYGAKNAKLDVFPNFVQPHVVIQTEAPGLSPEQVETYNREGYLVYPGQVFPTPKFEGLKAHFEQKLLNLPPEVRPEAMDVPHFTDLKLFDWLFADEVLSSAATLPMIESRTFTKADP